MPGWMLRRCAAHLKNQAAPRLYNFAIGCAWNMLAICCSPPIWPPTKSPTNRASTVMHTSQPYSKHTRISPPLNTAPAIPPNRAIPWWAGLDRRYRNLFQFIAICDKLKCNTFISSNIYKFMFYPPNLLIEYLQTRKSPWALSLINTWTWKKIRIKMLFSVVCAVLMPR